MRVALPLVILFSLPPLAIGARLPVAAVAATAGFGGAGLVNFNSLFITTVQRHVPEELLSRVVAYDWFGSLLAYPIGLAIAAPLADMVGIRVVLVVSALLEVVSIVAILAVRSVWNLDASPTEATPS
jgi:MFS family permease